PRKAMPFSPYTLVGPPLYGATFDHAARPCRPITGTVVDQKTKKPIPNVSVSGRYPGGWYEVAVRTRTDAAGRYRLTRLPNAECELTFAPKQPSAYLMLLGGAAKTPGLTPLAVDMAMVRGTVVSGRVTDARTGKPVQGFVRYATLAGNRHAL